MFHPVGSQSSAIYWRRRLLMFGLLVVTALTLYAACSSGSDGSAAQSAAKTSGKPSPTPTSAQSTSQTATASAPATSVAASACQPAALKISALTSAPAYKVGDQPTLSLQVVNSGPTPCVQDLADRQIELQIYNGASRVWGSHDCQIEPGTSPQTLPVGTAVRRSVVWTGLSSQPNCAGQRVRVGAGMYTLRASLAGHAGTTAQFTIS
jgi:hypothetical protein